MRCCPDVPLRQKRKLTTFDDISQTQTDDDGLATMLKKGQLVVERGRTTFLKGCNDWAVKVVLHLCELPSAKAIQEAVDLMWLLHHQLRLPDFYEKLFSRKTVQNSPALRREFFAHRLWFVTNDLRWKLERLPNAGAVDDALRTAFTLQLHFIHRCSSKARGLAEFLNSPAHMNQRERDHTKETKLAADILQMNAARVLNQ